jgi:hypothetical protein
MQIVTLIGNDVHYLIRSLTPVGCLALAACGSNASAPSFTVDSETIAFQSAGIDLTLPRNSGFDGGSFLGAADLVEGKGQIFAISEGDATFAAILVTRNDGVVAETFFGRTTTSNALPTGQATLEGSYVGVFENSEDDSLMSYITGTAVFEVDLDAMTISGEVTEATTDLFGLGLPFVLDEDARISFPESTILSNGTFGTIDELTSVDEETGDETVLTTDYSGLLGGKTAETAELVGTVTRSSITTGVRNNSSVTSTGRQTGVFAAGH